MAYDAREGIYLPKFGNYILSGLESGQKLAANQQAMQQQGRLGALAPKIAAGDKNAINQALMIDPSGKLFEGAYKIGQPQPAFEGTSIDAQAAQTQYQRYIQSGLSPAEAKYRAINDIRTTKQTQYVDELGRVQTQTGMALPDPMAALSQAKTEDEYIKTGASVLSNTPPEQRPQVWSAVRQGMIENNYEKPEDVPEEYSQEVEDSMLQFLAPNQDQGNVQAPIAQAERAKEAAKLGQQTAKEIYDESAAASEQIDSLQQVYDVYRSGFEGGVLSPAKFNVIQGKQAVGKPLTPEEQKFASDYAQLEAMASFNVAKSIKPIFGGNISDGEREFAINLQSQPFNLPEQAAWKAAVQEAGALQKIRKAQFLDQWVKANGAPEAKNADGESFSTVFGKYVDQNPIFTPVFIAERGIPVPLGRNAEQVFDSLPIGAKFINPKDGRVLTKNKERQ